MTMASSIEDRTLAVSETGSPLDICNSELDRKIEFPPSFCIPISNETLVRVEGFSKTKPRDLLSKELGNLSKDFSSKPLSIIEESSSFEKLWKFKKCFGDIVDAL